MERPDNLSLEKKAKRATHSDGLGPGEAATCSQKIPLFLADFFIGNEEGLFAEARERPSMGPLEETIFKLTEMLI